MGISIRYKRAEEVFGTLLAKYHAHAYPYEKLMLPQETKNLPASMPRGGREEGLFWLAVCYYMRMTESVGAVRSMAKLYEASPGFFFPETFEATVEEKGDLLDHLRQGGLGFQSAQVARGWALNLKMLASYWGGDPRNLYKSATTYDELCKRMIVSTRKVRAPHLFGKPHGLFGFRHKMVSMLTYFYVDAGLVPPILHPVPVDFHVMRILLTNEILVVNDPSAPQNADKISAAGRKVTFWYAKKHGVDPIDLCNVLWYLSRTYCKQQLGNQSIVGPQNGRATEVTPYPVEWTSARITKQWRVCGRCPIEPTCRYNVPIATYSRQGLLILRGERPVPPQRMLCAPPVGASRRMFFEPLGAQDRMAHSFKEEQPSADQLVLF